MKQAYAILVCAGILTASSVLMGAESKPSNEGSSEPQLTLTSGFDFVTVKGDSNRYRADNWLYDGWTGGIEDLTWQRELGKDWAMDLNSHAIFGNGDYKVELAISKTDVGFVNVGFKQYRKYYDSTGGYYRFTSGGRAFDLNKSLFMDIGDLTVDFGLTLPNLPKVIVGYERVYKDGSKSLLEWGSVYSGSLYRKIAPTEKDIDEAANIFKLSIEHDIKKIHVGDEFRYESYENNTYRVACNSNNVNNATLTVPSVVRVWETFDHDFFYNAFHLDSQMTKNFYWSLGYMYNNLSGSDSYNMDLQPPANNSRLYHSHAIDVDEDSHVVNGSVFFTPHKDLSIYAGLQYENTATRGFLDGDLARGIGTTGQSVVAVLWLDKTQLESVEGNLGARFTGIPLTTIYAEGRWQNQNIGKSENDLLALTVDNIDTEVSRRWFTVGMACSPIQRATLSAQYRYSYRHNGYTPDDELISDQSFTSDEFSTKLTLRPHSKFNASFRFQRVDTKINSAFESINSNESGHYYLNIYSVSATVTPISRLYLTGLFSYQDTGTDTYRNTASLSSNPSLIGLPYRGNVWTVLGTAGYALDNKTDLTATYSYSRCDNFTDNSTVGMPFGLDNQRHSLQVAISRRLRKNIAAQIRYGYAEYAEVSNGGVDNYQAHQVGASCTIKY